VVAAFAQATSQVPLVRRLLDNTIAVTIERIQGQWVLSGHHASGQGASGLVMRLDDQFLPQGNAVEWPNATSYPTICSHALDNGNLMSVGSHYSPSFHARYLYFNETDANGQLIAAHRYLDPDSLLNIGQYTHAYNATHTRLVIYYQHADLDGLACFNKEGQLLWAHRVQTGDMVFDAITSTSDGGWLAVARLSQSGGNGGDDLVVKLDSLGAMVWSKRYGVIGWHDRANAVHENEDGSFSVGGALQSNVNTPDPFLHASILRLSPSGDLLWSRCFSKPGGEGWISITDIDELPDGRVICTGYEKDSLLSSNEARMFLMQLSATGEVLEGIGYSAGASSLPWSNFIEVADDHLTLAAVMTANGTDIIVTGADLHPPCNSVPFIWEEVEHPYLDTTLTMTTADFTLIYDTLVQNENQFVPTSDELCTTTIGAALPSERDRCSPYFRGSDLILELDETDLPCQITLMDAAARIVMQRMITDRGTSVLPITGLVPGYYSFRAQAPRRVTGANLVFIR
jgi:hypothetical protein